MPSGPRGWSRSGTSSPSCGLRASTVSSAPWSPRMPAEPVAASVHIDAPPELVYQYFTRPEAIVRWMGDFALLEPRPDGEFTLDIRGARVRGRYLELEPPHRILISWGYAGSRRLPPGASVVEVRLN